MLTRRPSSQQCRLPRHWGERTSSAWSWPNLGVQLLSHPVRRTLFVRVPYLTDAKLLNAQDKDRGFISRKASLTDMRRLSLADMGLWGTCSNHEEESEFIYGDDVTRLTACNFGSNDCARSWR